MPLTIKISSIWRQSITQNSMVFLLFLCQKWNISNTLYNNHSNYLGFHLCSWSVHTFFFVMFHALSERNTNHSILLKIVLSMWESSREENWGHCVMLLWNHPEWTTTNVSLQRKKNEDTHVLCTGHIAF